MAVPKFISDLHLGQRGVTRYRTGFNSTDEHNELVIHNVASALNKRDTLYILGDVCFDLNVLPMLRRIKCERKVLVLGNHCLEQGPKHIIEYLPYFDDIQGFVQYKKFWLSHCPIHPAELRGRVNIHGHDHADGLHDARYVNVCAEHIGYRPVTLDQIQILIKRREQKKSWIPSRAMWD